MIGTTAALIGLGIAGASAGASMYGASKAAGAAEKAADTQAAAAEQAGKIGQDAAQEAQNRILAQAGRSADQIDASSRDAIRTLQMVYDRASDSFVPYQQGGTEALAGLRALAGGPGFDPSTVQMDPGFAFRLQEGQKAVERSAAARGVVLGGEAAKALTRYAQDYSSGEYNNAYNRGLTTYQTNWNNRVNALLPLLNAGENANASALNAGEYFGGRTADTTLRAGELQADYGFRGAGAASDYGMQGAEIGANALTGGAAARASGYVGAGNAWNQGLGNAFNSAQNLYSLALLSGWGRTGAGDSGPGGSGPQGSLATIYALAPYVQRPNLYTGYQVPPVG